jgi:hypothetical protein
MSPLMDRAGVEYLWGRGLQTEDGAQGRVDLDHADRGKLSERRDEAGSGVAEPRRVERPNLETEEDRVIGDAFTCVTFRDGRHRRRDALRDMGRMRSRRFSYLTRRGG